MENKLEIIQENKAKFKLRAEARLKNALLIEAREKLELTSKDTAEKIGIGYYTYISCETMRYYPSLKTQEKICKFYNSQGIPLSIQDVFPEELRLVKPQKFIFTQEIPREYLIPIQEVDRRLLIDTSMEEGINKKDLEKMLNNAIETLSPREGEILKLYFGLGDNQEELVLEEISEKLGVSKERVRQIKEKALARLRRPPRSKDLRDFLYEN